MQPNQSEVITIQAGPLANRVCTHFWNLQEYGSSEKSKATECEFPFTYQVLFDDSTRKLKPRALAIDVREVVDFGIELDPILIPTSFDVPLWNSQVDQVIRSSPKSNANKHSFCNWVNCLSPSARRIWAHDDILFKLPVSLQPVLSEFVHDETYQTDSTVGLSTFTEGQDIYRSGNKVADECDDRIRRLAERCSLANSFQLFVDAEDGFTGIGFRLLENITEEFPKAFIFSVPIYNTSIVSRMNMRLQKIASVNQLCLLNILESSGDFLSHGCWLPMDISELSDHHHSCQKMSVLASVLDTITTPSKLAHKLGGLNLGNLFSMTSYTQGRKMLTVQTGVCCDTASDDQLSWYNLNPYYNQGKRIFGESMSPQPVLWRQFTSRGIKDSILIDSLWKICNETNDSNKFVKNSVDSLDIPFLCASGLARSIYTLPDYPLQTSAMKQVNPLAHCKQYTNTYAACIVDAPNTNSYESKTLEKLVKSLLPHKSHPLDSFMEVETWNDFLESVQTRLVDSYTRE